MKKLVFSLLFFIGYLGFAQKIYMANSMSKGITAFINENSLPTVDFVYQNTFITNNKYDEAKLVQTITKLYPNKNQRGMAVLDWEGVAFDNLIKNKDVSNASKIQFEQAIKKAKALRPNVKWSFYGLPTRNFWNPDQNWKSKNLDLISLFSNFDFIAPSIYIFYPLNEVKENLQNKYIDSNIQLAKEIGQKVGKPVYPIVNHRYHPSNKKYGNQLVSKELFSYYISRIASNQIDTIIWWQSEEYNYNVSRSNAVFKADYSKKISKDLSQQQMLNEYYNTITRNK
ncbi:hypothetical protein [Chryseobacterium flavum]|uniref:hypothetical protein n=1 Tax=Chryseobacterium flavum TaxID=415851 RepID=UPI0028A5B770|nr:hypothetical protein [Chryseobacterium flavum]